MAEVKISITAEDKASGAIGALGSALDSMRSGAAGFGVVFRDIEARTIDASAGALAYAGRINQARIEASALCAEIRGMSLARAFELDVSSALSGAHAVKSAIDAIPDVSYKTVIIEYQTKASPVRPFTEGIELIRRKMESLPQETTHTVRYLNESAEPKRAASSSSPMPQGSQQVHFAPSITVVSGRGDAATEIDRALAELWLRHRSELRRAIEQ